MTYFTLMFPLFDLTGYGTSEDEAKKSLSVTLDEFLRYTINKNTFIFELVYPSLLRHTIGSKHYINKLLESKKPISQRQLAN